MVMKKLKLPLLGLLLGCGLVSSKVFAAGQQPFEESVSHFSTSLSLPPQTTLDRTKSPIAEEKTALSTQDAAIFQNLMQRAIDQKFDQLPMGERMQAIAEQFIGSPYEANLLDQSPETLKISLQKFDCVLFVETVLAMARGIAQQDYSASTFIHHVREQRYVDGKTNGYCSRLHYFSEWLADNQKRGIVTNLTASLSGVSLKKSLNFMSAHWQKYPQLANSKANRDCIAKMESTLGSIQYIPYEQIRRQYSALKPGDVIAIATDLPGLDVTHTGLIYRSPSGEIGLIHAAPGRGVKISPDLERYVGRVDHAIGILVARSSVEP
jgi:Protein of unknown function (DUF1460)